MGINRLPGQTWECRCGRGDGVIVGGRGRPGDGLNSPQWWAQSPPRYIKVDGESVVRASAHMCPTSCYKKLVRLQVSTDSTDLAGRSQDTLYAQIPTKWEHNA